MDLPIKNIPITRMDSATSPPAKSKRRRISSQDFIWENNSIPSTPSMNSAPISPQNYLRKLFQSRDIHISITPVSSLQNYFRNPNDKDYSSYQEDVVKALRARDIETLHQMLKEGRSLQCCNRFGESLFHMACRRSYDDVVQFLINEGVSPKIKDDLDRTPMHDAFWTAKPNFKLVKTLIMNEPLLLFLSDKRGHTPLDYARKNDWHRWVEFLSSNVDLLIDLYLKCRLT